MDTVMNLIATNERVIMRQFGVAIAQWNDNSGSRYCNDKSLTAYTTMWLNTE